ncbi:MAG: DNA gyrase inhibitor YacG [Nitrosomonas sp.]|nr:DNA gyrase inhibitor YacG [Nitrosomonas sp.]MDR4650797.1 DNA gyrase inhibitor YacG [Nitrosomonas sp.]
MKQRMVNCPQCGKSVVWNSSNTSRPFCSERCKTMDLGQWAQESYRLRMPENETENKA